MTAARQRTSVTAPEGVAATAHHAHAVLHCNLNTGDLERSEAFYVDAFGLQARMRSRNPDDDGTPMGLGTHTASVTAFLYDRRGPRAAPALELVGWQEPALAPRGATSTGPATIGLRTGYLGAAADAVRAAGGHVSPVEGGVQVRGTSRPALVTSDPDGVVVEIVEIAPVGDEDATTPALSHERLCCADIDASIAWYAVLGWVVRSRSADGQTASLVLPEDPTFSLELQHDPTVMTTSPSTATTQGLYRMALAVEDVQAAHDALQAHVGAPVPDPWFFAMPDVPTSGFTALFLADPDGVVVELVERPRSAVRRPTQPS